MVPARSLLKCTPNSTALLSLTSGVVGVAEGDQMVAPTMALPVVKVQENGVIMTLPARSVTPLIVAV